jgi:hypothetical protein
MVKKKPAALRISPAVLTLAPGDPGAQLVAERAGTHGGLLDLTSQAAWSAEPAGVVAIEPGGYVRALGAGKATIRAVQGESRAEIPVSVLGEEAKRDWSFAEDIVPVLTRSGCNTGGCHGKAEGQNGFHLSLFGYDPAGDYLALTRDAGGRRLDRLAPDRSLMLLKALGRTPHGGGPRIKAGSPEHQTVLAWIEAGAPERRGATHGSLVALAVEPGDNRLDAPGPRQLRVVARYADGHLRDVTRLASYRVNDDSAASIDPLGHAALLRRAETDLVVRFQSQVMSTRLATLINPDLVFDFKALPRRNFIDDELYKRLESLKVPPSPPASDAAFLRRVTLDLTGQQPDTDEIRKYLADTDPEKRVKLVDRLLATRFFMLFWKIKLGDMLQASPARLGNGFYKYDAWLGACLKENTPWNEAVRSLLTALGEPEKDGPVNFALESPDAKTLAEQTAQHFLGLRIRCAQCHDHPFDVWTQDDYFGLAACFARVERTGGGQGGMMGRTRVRLNPDGQVEHLRTKRPAAPRLLDGRPVDVAPQDDPRKVLAGWITAPENPYFARAMANWVWAQFFGKGLADPADDLGRSNPPVHPELLDALARHFVAHKFDLQDLIRTIATSESYALSSATVPGNESDRRLFSHQIPRPLTAHQMADALAQATGVENHYGRDSTNLKVSRRAVELSDPTTPSAILDTFGRCTRANGCSAVAAPSLSLRQALLLIGGDVLESKVANPRGYLAETLELKPEPDELVENLYLRTLCRFPTEAESAHWTKALKEAPVLRDAAEDLFWALLNAREFAFNH